MEFHQFTTVWSKWWVHISQLILHEIYRYFPSLFLLILETYLRMTYSKICWLTFSKDELCKFGRYSSNLGQISWGFKKSTSSFLLLAGWASKMLIKLFTDIYLLLYHQLAIPRSGSWFWSTAEGICGGTVCSAIVILLFFSENIKKKFNIIT